MGGCGNNSLFYWEEAPRDLLFCLEGAFSCVIATYTRLVNEEGAGYEAATHEAQPETGAFRHKERQVYLHIGK